MNHTRVFSPQICIVMKITTAIPLVRQGTDQSSQFHGLPDELQRHILLLYYDLLVTGTEDNRLYRLWRLCRLMGSVDPCSVFFSVPTIRGAEPIFTKASLTVDRAVLFTRFTR